MTKSKIKESNIIYKKNEINQKHILFYDKILSSLEFILENFTQELARTDIKYLEIPKNTITTMDFIISSIGKIQKGQRLALGLDVEEFEDTSPVINIIEGVNESKI